MSQSSLPLFGDPAFRRFSPNEFRNSRLYHLYRAFQLKPPKKYIVLRTRLFHGNLALPAVLPANL